MDARALRRLAAEHLHHALGLDRLDAALAARPVDADVALAEFREVDRGLGEHLRHEEAVLFPWLVSVLPARAADVEQLQRDHIELLANATVLRLALGEAAEFTPASANALRRFAGLLRRHLEEEERLVAEASQVRRGAEGPAAGRS